MDLDAIPWQTTRWPGIRIHFYASDKQTRRTVALIAMAPGHGYPRHRHQGQEEVLVLQGAYQDEQGTHQAGSYVLYDDQSEHTPVATPDATCVLLAIAHEGIELLQGRS